MKERSRIIEMKITEDIRYIGVNDHEIDLFEGQYTVKNGMAYNSYLITDKKTAVMDTVDVRFGGQWMTNLQAALGSREPDYLIVQHMEPDHSANIALFMRRYTKAAIVATAKAFAMMKQFFGTDFADRRIVVKEGDTLSLGKHLLTFVTAPMVHWPEVMVTYDSCDRVLFSADGFGKFGALDAEEDWTDEARRYYIGIVGKYGAQVQNLLKKAAKLDIQMICPLHGPVLKENLEYYLNLYHIWSSYEAEEDGIVVAYTSVYGHTGQAVQDLAQMLRAGGCPRVAVYDLARCDMAQAVSDAFRCSKLVLATTTYNAGIFPFMREFIEHLTERNFQNRTVALIENGSWAPMAAKVMKEMLAGCRNLTFAEPVVHIKSALDADSSAQLRELAKELTKEYAAQNGVAVDKNNPAALFDIGYGLYVVTSRDGERDNGCIVNTVMQVTNTPNRIAVAVSKQNYTYEIVKKTGIMNVNCLAADAPLELFQNFGFQSGRTADKFAGQPFFRSDNGLIFLARHITSFLSLKTEQYVDLGTHGLFICSVTEARIISEAQTMSYSYYQENVKPKPQSDKKKGFVCKVCGYIYEGDVLPDDFICPLCKHGAADFEPLA